MKGYWPHTVEIPLHGRVIAFRPMQWCEETIGEGLYFPTIEGLYFSIIDKVPYEHIKWIYWFTGNDGMIFSFKDQTTAIMFKLLFE